MSKSKSLQPLARILASDTQIAAWNARMQRESRLTTAVRCELPRALAERVRVAEASTSTLQLAVAAGAVAAVIRQRTPDILAGLRREGWDFTELRVRVQVRDTPGEGPARLKIQRDRIVSAPLSQLASDLPQGPLRTAIERLVRRSG
jgi:hypothetical protein